MRRAFTLVELVLVLAILSILSVMALKELSRGESLFRREKSDRALEELASAIVGDVRWGDGTLRDGERRVVARAFVSDLGRLPRALRDPDDPDRGELTLAELFVCPDDVVRYGAHAASNNVSGAAASCADDDLTVAFGWRGPYLQPTAGRAFCRDGWGNAFTARAYGEAGFDPATARIFPIEDYRARHRPDDAVPGVGFPGSYTNGFIVGGLRHLGSDGLEEMCAPRLYAVTSSPALFVNRDRVIDLSGAYVESVRVKVTADDATQSGGKCGVRLYGPIGAPSADEVRRATVGVWERTAKAGETVVFTAADFRDRPLTIGRRVLRAWAANGGVTNLSAAVSVDLRRVNDELELHIEGGAR